MLSGIIVSHSRFSQISPEFSHVAAVLKGPAAGLALAGPSPEDHSPIATQNTAPPPSSRPAARRRADSRIGKRCTDLCIF